MIEEPAVAANHVLRQLAFEDDAASSVGPRLDSTAISSSPRRRYASAVNPILKLEAASRL